MTIEDEVVFYLHDPAITYTPQQVKSIVARAELQGYPLEKGSYIEKMTVSQLERLLERRYDA